MRLGLTPTAILEKGISPKPCHRAGLDGGGSAAGDAGCLWYGL